jgi:regulatory protein
MTNPRSSFKPNRVSKEKALQKLKHYCGYQERSHGEVKEKSYSLGLFRNEVEEVISALIEEGYLNEERFALRFASGKSRIKGWGKQKILHGLREKGVSSFNIRKALDGIDPDEYAKSFSRHAEKKWLSLKREKNIFVKKTKWRNYLLQRGFEPALIQSFSFPEKAGGNPD